VQLGDIILMGTDGVWDNFKRADAIEFVIKKMKSNQKFPENLVQIADIAFDIVKRSFEVSPALN
jgi:serine/threonine protein phosphatase PrpC